MWLECNTYLECLNMIYFAVLLDRKKIVHGKRVIFLAFLQEKPCNNNFFKNVSCCYYHHYYLLWDLILVVLALKFSISPSLLVLFCLTNKFVWIFHILKNPSSNLAIPLRWSSFSFISLPSSFDPLQCDFYFSRHWDGTGWVRLLVTP